MHAITCDSTVLLSWLLNRGLDPNIDLRSRKEKEEKVDIDEVEEKTAKKLRFALADPIDEVEEEEEAKKPRFALPGAIASGHYDLAEMLLENAADVNLSDPYWGTACYAAYKRRSQEWLTKLISLGARIEEPIWLRDSCHKIAHIVASEGDVEMMDCICDKGINIMTCCGLCGPVLSSTVKAENIDMMRYLAKKGCDINDLNVYGTPLLKWAEDDLLDDAHSELTRLGATKIVSQRRVELQIENSVALLCEELSSINTSQPWSYRRSGIRWFALGRCLLIGNDPENALIALEQTLDFDEDDSGDPDQTMHSSIGCYCHEPGRYHLCQNSTSKPICESECLRNHEEELRMDGKLENHPHLMYPRPFFSAEIKKGYVALDENHQIPRETWLESLQGWKFQPPPKK